jgi:8-oxo-dGTP pyrophosphatase MutT (NUDIX family)/GH24 family phage-related lysozyme (muramidase)
MPFEPDQDDFLDADQGTREYWGSEAAGCIFIARDTGRILLAHRSNQVDYEPETWGTWGGKVDVGETPKDTVEREVEEETGFTGRYKIHPLYVYRDGEFSYHNYLVIVPFEFTPQLNWENEGSAWVEYGQWPEPLHFGMEELIKHSGAKIKQIINLIKKRKLSLKEMDNPPAIHHEAPIFSREFIEYIKSVENDKRVGFKDRMWYPHTSPEGGLPTIGYGHKIKTKHELNKFTTGVQDQVIERLLISDLQDANKKAKDDIKQMFNVQIPLDQTQEEILTDYTFNLGTLKGFPKFTKAVLNKDWDSAKKEYKRIFKDKYGNQHELGRNTKFARRYLKETENTPIQVLPQGLIDISTQGYKWVTPYGYLAFGYDKTSNIFHLLMIQTKPEFREKGYSKELLRKFFEFMKEKKGRLDPGSYTVSGMAWVKHVLERFSKEWGVPIINVRHPQDA